MNKKTPIIALTMGFVLSVFGNSGSPQIQNLEIQSLKPVKTVDHLKEEGIAGEVAFWAVIDVHGNVRTPMLIRSLHPELDKLALEAVRQWKYEPYIHHGEPIAVPTAISVVFHSGAPKISTGEDVRPAEPLSEEMKSLLNRSAVYSRKLSEAAPFFICRESGDQAVSSVFERVDMFNWTLTEDGYRMMATYVYPALKSGRKNARNNDYQLLQANGRFEEMRIPPEEGRWTIGGNLPPMGIPIRVFGLDRRSSFGFQIIDEDRIRGRNVLVLEIKSRQKQGSEIKAGKVWVDKIDARIHRVEVELASPALDESILAECRRYQLTPHLSATIEYEVERNGLLYPGRADYRLDYTGLVRPLRDTKAKLTIRYDRYRFFSVETEPKIIKCLARPGLAVSDDR
jgi:hypothetical protein